MSYVQFEKQSAPNSPGPNKYKWYHRDSDGKPVFLDENGVEHEFVGEKGDQGDPGAQGPQGPKGVKGDQGPAGSMSLISKSTNTSLITLPNTTNKSFVYRTSFIAPVGTNGYLIATLGFKAHSTGNDMEFDWELNGQVLDGDYIEEHKDSSGAAKNLRTFQIDLGVLNDGAYDLDLYFSKEATGGTAQVKYISTMVMGV